MTLKAFKFRNTVKEDGTEKQFCTFVRIDEGYKDKFYRADITDLQTKLVETYKQEPIKAGDILIGARALITFTNFTDKNGKIGKNYWVTIKGFKEIKRAVFENKIENTEQEFAI